jgi:hypothetical protein
MKPITKTEAATKSCPFKTGTQLGDVNICTGFDCMAWKEVHNEVKREDHSGAHDIVLGWAVDSNRIMRREGRAGSYGILILDAVGHCSFSLGK